MPMRPKKNPVTKLVAAGVKAAAKAAGKKATKPLANPKSAVKVKPAAKQQPNKPDTAKNQAKEHNTRYRAGNSAYRQNMKDQTKANYSGYGQGSHGDAVLEANIAQQEARIGRKAAILKKKAESKPNVSRPVNNSTANPFANRVKINTDPTKPKGVFGPLKKKAAAANTPANRAKAKANARGLKAAQGKSLAPKGYKPDTAGRKEVKRFATPLEKANGKKTAMRMGAQTIDIGRSSLKIKAAPKNRGK